MRKNIWFFLILALLVGCSNAVVNDPVSLEEKNIEIFDKIYPNLDYTLTPVKEYENYRLANITADNYYGTVFSTVGCSDISLNDRETHRLVYVNHIEEIRLEESLKGE